MKTVAIIGAGLGGLTLALSLAKENEKHNCKLFDIHIFERDDSIDTRAQGYLIGINRDGTDAVQALGIDIEAMNRGRGYNFAITDQSLRMLMSVENDGSLVNRGEVRVALYEMIMISDHVEMHWGWKFESYEEVEDIVLLNFEGGRGIQCDFVVGADGASSKVRKIKSPGLIPQRIEKTHLAGWCYYPDEEEIPILHALLEDSACRIVSGMGVSFLVFRYITYPDEQDCILWVINDGTVGRLFLDNQDPIPEEIYEFTRNCGFHEEIQHLIEMTDIENYVLHGYLRASDPSLVTLETLGDTSRVILLGDSAHTMTSHRGLGANTAFLDAMDLCNALVSISEDDSNWRIILHQYESIMMKRGKKHVSESIQSTNMIHMSGWQSKFRDWGMWTVWNLLSLKKKFF